MNLDLVYPCNEILCSRANEKSTAIHINMDKYQVIMLSEKNRSHKSRVLFTKNKTKNYICLRVHMQAKGINKSKGILSYLWQKRKRDRPWRHASDLQIMQCSYVLGAVGKLVRCLRRTQITAEWLKKSEPSRVIKNKVREGGGWSCKTFTREGLK